MAPPETVSAVMPVHAGTTAAHLAEALESMLSQTRVPDEVVVVEDGPLDPDHRAVLDRFEARHPRVRRIALPVNRGAGVANQAGLEAATGEWVAKFDADDICRPERLDRQLRLVGEQSVDVCGTAMLEFDQDPAHPVALRSNPLTHDAIARRMRFNNPINHPSSLYRRELAVRAGGYADLRFMQDYDLFARMLASGARMANLAEPLVLFRAGAEMRGRRTAREFTRLEWQLQRRLVSYGLIGRPRALANLVVRVGFRKLPRPLLALAYRRVLSRPIPEEAP